MSAEYLVHHRHYQLPSSTTLPRHPRPHYFVLLLQAAALPSIPIPQPVPTAFQHIPQSQAAVHTMQQVASQPMGAGPHIPIATPVGDGVVALKAVQAKAIAEAAALASAPCSRSHQLTAVGQWDGHGGAIFAMAYDAVHDNLICGGRDMSVMVWSKQGQVVHK